MTSVPSSHATVVIIGGGTMGAGIAQSALAAVETATVFVVERDDDAAQVVRERLIRDLRRHAARTGADGDDLIARLHVVAGMPTTVAAELVVEAVPEDAAMKAVVLARAGATWPSALLASNTSSLSINELAHAVPAPERFLGMHFFNPVPRSELVEIIVGAETAEQTCEQAQSWVDVLGKQSIVVRDAPGFATSRLGVAIGLEAIRMLEEGVADATDIDKGMVLGYKFPIGPLALTDMIGLDVRLAIAEHLAVELGSRFDPPALLRQKVEAGELGKKTGLGFFAYPSQP